jgi:hypothetical protein
LSSQEFSGFKNIAEPELAAKSFIGPAKPDKQSVGNQDIADLLEQYKEKKKQINNYSAKIKTKEIRMPTELTNARNISVKISE